MGLKAPAILAPPGAAFASALNLAYGAAMRGAQEHMRAPGEPPTPTDSPLRLADIRTSAVYRNLSTPAVAVGDPAPVFRLPRLDVTRAETMEIVDLGDDLGRRPVALIFGSYT